MCPYYNQEYKKCIIFKTYPMDDTRNRYCEECSRPYTECPNYQQAKVYNNGTVPPPYKYK